MAKPSPVELTGKLIAGDSDEPWLLLRVPRAIMLGLYTALDEPKAKLSDPPAHISVMSGKEVKALGGISKIKEVGEERSFNLGGVKAVEPEGWPEMEKAWFLECDAPSLEKLRESYGLPAKIKDHEFHITFAVLPRSSSKKTTSSKEAALGARQIPLLAAALAPVLGYTAGDLYDARREKRTGERSRIGKMIGTGVGAVPLTYMAAKHLGAPADRQISAKAPAKPAPQVPKAHSVPSPVRSTLSVDFPRPGELRNAADSAAASQLPKSPVGPLASRSVPTGRVEPATLGASLKDGWNDLLARLNTEPYYDSENYVPKDVNLGEAAETTARNTAGTTAGIAGLMSLKNPANFLTNVRKLGPNVAAMFGTQALAEQLGADPTSIGPMTLSQVAMSRGPAGPGSPRGGGAGGLVALSLLQELASREAQAYGEGVRGFKMMQPTTTYLADRAGRATELSKLNPLRRFGALALDPFESVSMLSNIPNIMHEDSLAVSDAASRVRAQLQQLGTSLVKMKNSGTISPERYSAGVDNLVQQWYRATGKPIGEEPWFSGIKARL